MCIRDRGNGVIDEDVSAQALSFFEVDPLGLDAVDNRILELLCVPVSYTHLAAEHGGLFAGKRRVGDFGCGDAERLREVLEKRAAAARAGLVLSLIHI